MEVLRGGWFQKEWWVRLMNRQYLGGEIHVTTARPQWRVSQCCEPVLESVVGCLLCATIYAQPNALRSTLLDLDVVAMYLLV